MHRKLLYMCSVLVNRKRSIFFHHNVWSYLAQLTLQKFIELDNETLLHPPYPADFSPTDLHYTLHNNNDNFLRKKCFKKEEDPKNTINAMIIIMYIESMCFYFD